QRFGKVARREFGNLPEGTAERCGGGIQFFGEGSEPQSLFAGIGEETRGALDQNDGTRGLIGPATETRTEALFFRFFLRIEEKYVSPQGPPRRARGTTVNVRGAHRKKKAAVGAGITRKRGAPEASGGARGNPGFDGCVLAVHGVQCQHGKNNARRDTNLSGKAQQSLTHRT